MAAEATFNQSTGGNYRRHGGNHWTVGGSQNFLSGSSVSFESGSQVHIQSGTSWKMDGPIDLSTAGAYIKGFLETGTTTADLKAYGVSTVTKTSAGGANGYTLAAPIIGVQKSILFLMADSSDTVTVDMAGSGASLESYSGQTLNKLVCATSGATNNPAGGITLVGLTTLKWGWVSSFGTIATTS